MNKANSDSISSSNQMILCVQQVEVAMCQSAAKSAQFQHLKRQIAIEEKKIEELETDLRDQLEVQRIEIFKEEEYNRAAILRWKEASQLAEEKEEKRREHNYLKKNIMRQMEEEWRRANLIENEQEKEIMEIQFQIGQSQKTIENIKFDIEQLKSENSIIMSEEDQRQITSKNKGEQFLISIKNKEEVLNLVQAKMFELQKLQRNREEIKKEMIEIEKKEERNKKGQQQERKRMEDCLNESKEKYERVSRYILNQTKDIKKDADILREYIKKEEDQSQQQSNIQSDKMAVIELIKDEESKEIAKQVFLKDKQRIIHSQERSQLLVKQIQEQQQHGSSLEQQKKELLLQKRSAEDRINAVNVEKNRDDNLLDENRKRANVIQMIDIMQTGNNQQLIQERVQKKRLELENLRQELNAKDKKLEEAYQQIEDYSESIKRQSEQAEQLNEKVLDINKQIEELEKKKKKKK